MAVELISKSAYARLRGCDEKAVRKAINEGRISLIDGKIDPTVADIQWARNTRARASQSTPAAAGASGDLLGALPSPALGDAPPAPATPIQSDGYTAARARREIADAETAEIQLRKLRGDVLITADVARAGFEIGREIRDAMESATNSLAGELAPLTSAEACAEVLRRHNRALQDLLSKCFREKIGKLPAVTP